MGCKVTKADGLGVAPSEEGPQSKFPFSPLVVNEASMAPGVVGFSPAFLPVDPALTCQTKVLLAAAASRKSAPKSKAGPQITASDWTDGAVVDAAAIIAKAEESYHGREWVGLETLAWLRYAIENAHCDDGLKAAGLRLLSRVNTYGSKWKEVGPLTPKDVLDLIQATATRVASRLIPEMMAYRRENHLAETLGVLTLPSPTLRDPSDTGASRPGSPGSVQLVQRGHLAIFDPELRGLIAPMTGSEHEYETNLIGLLTLICQYLMPMWDAQTSHLGGKELQRLPPPKTFTRMDNKRIADYSNPEEYPFPTAMHNKDPLRKSIRSTSAAEQIGVWDQLCKSFEVCGLKNAFAATDEQAEQDGGMMQILSNIVFKPVAHLPGKVRLPVPLTFKMMVEDIGTSTQGGIDGLRAAFDRAAAKEPVHTAVFSRAWNILKTLLPKIGDREVEIVAEIQLHLDFYLLRRKVTHLLFKITRARTLRELKEDCFASDKDKTSPSRAALIAATERAERSEPEVAGKLNPKFQPTAGGSNRTAE